MNDRDPAPLERLADLLVFAPLGFALEARRLWPGLAARGREQLHMTREAGTRALGGPYGWLDHRIAKVREEADAAIKGLGLAPTGGRSVDVVADPGAESDGSGDAVVHLTRERATPAHGRSRADTAGTDLPPLAIPDYDSLSASQVVPRLAGLQPDELEQVRRYEDACRGRKTILNRIAQLQVG